MLWIIPDGTCGLNFTVGSLQMELVLSTSQLDVIRISHTDPPVTLAPKALQSQSIKVIRKVSQEPERGETIRKEGKRLERCRNGEL